MSVVAIDDFPQSAPNLWAPASSAIVVSPSDSDELTHVARALVVGSGTVKVLTLENDTVTLPDMGANWQWNLRVRQVYATGTTATVIVALY